MSTFISSAMVPDYFFKFGWADCRFLARGSKLGTSRLPLANVEHEKTAADFLRLFGVSVELTQLAELASTSSLEIS